MAIVPFKLWEDMKRWKEEQIQKPRLPPNPNVSATASLQRDLSSVMANEDLSEAEKSQLYGQTLHKGGVPNLPTHGFRKYFVC